MGRSPVCCCASPRAAPAAHPHVHQDTKATPGRGLGTARCSPRIASPTGENKKWVYGEEAKESSE